MLNVKMSDASDAANEPVSHQINFMPFVSPDTMASGWTLRTSWIGGL